MKLKTKIQLFSSLFMLLFIGLVNTSIYFLFYKISADTQLELLANETNSIVETLRANPDIPQSQLLAAFVPDNGVIRIIERSGNEKISTLTKRNVFTELPFQFFDYEAKTIERDEKGHYIAIVYKPIIWEDGSVVTLQVADYLYALDEVMNTLLYVLLAASLIILIPIIIAGNLLSKFILQPIQQLIQTMKVNISEKNWQTIHIQNKSKDELYEMEKTFNDMIEHLKESFQRQEDFVSDASHELKTPISIIKSYAQLLQRRWQTHPEVIPEAIAAINSETDRMQHLIEQLLALAKNKNVFPFVSFDLVPLTEKTVHTFREAYERKIELKIEEQAMIIDGNEEQIKQIIYILLSNALTYSKEKVVVQLSIDDAVALLKVIDDGPGIAATDQKRIFDRFYRVDKARTRQSGGTGLGLAIAKQIAEAHDGTIEVRSELQKGATFILRIPCKR